MASNKYPGKCSCGAFVDIGEGTVAKRKGKWQITCDLCAAPAASAERFEIIRVLTKWPLGDEVSEPHPILYSTLDEARAAAQNIYAGRGGYSEAETQELLLCEIHRIELRGKSSAIPAGFIECVARANATA